MDAIDFVVRPVIWQFKALLPAAQWRAVCMHTMHLLQFVVDTLSHAQTTFSCPGSQGHDAQACTQGTAAAVECSEGALGDVDGEDSFSGANAVVLAEKQLIICILYDAVNCATPAVRPASCMVCLQRLFVSQIYCLERTKESRATS